VEESDSRLECEQEISLNFWKMDNEIIPCIEDYRKAPSISALLTASSFICYAIQSQLRLFVRGLVFKSDVDDVWLESLIAISTGLPKFKGNTLEEFWGWCYAIAKNKAKDHHRKQFANPLDPLPAEELWSLVEASAAKEMLSAEVEIDLLYAMNLLGKAKPECRELLWNRYIVGRKLAELAREFQLESDAVRMRIVRCIEFAQSLIKA
jgi:RNA polymerase sigma factor (sigma-70 family)